MLMGAGYPHSTQVTSSFNQHHWIARHLVNIARTVNEPRAHAAECRSESASLWYGAISKRHTKDKIKWKCWSIGHLIGKCDWQQRQQSVGAGFIAHICWICTRANSIVFFIFVPFIIIDWLGWVRSVLYLRSINFPSFNLFFVSFFPCLLRRPLQMGGRKEMKKKKRREAPFFALKSNECRQQKEYASAWQGLGGNFRCPYMYTSLRWTLFISIEHRRDACAHAIEAISKEDK